MSRGRDAALRCTLLVTLFSLWGASFAGTGDQVAIETPKTAEQIEEESLTEPETKEDFPWDGNRNTPVHNFPIYDEDGQQVIPQYKAATPMSSRNTCGSCHTYSLISTGWHTNASKNLAEPGRPGEPWVLVDAKTGTQLPLSYRQWPGVYNPEKLGITPWQFTKLFGRHSTGGDVSEPQDVNADPEARWQISGKLEINCLGCHNAEPQDGSEWALQTRRENFRWAATAAAGLGTVDGMAARLKNSWIMADGPNRDDSEYAVVPTVDYHDSRFDSRNRTVFDVSHKGLDRNCVQCHSVTPAGAHRWRTDGDVHSVAGLQCADCHRSGLDHMMVRGYEEEAKDRNMRSAGDYTCRGCHLGTSDGRKVAEQGRMGAPTPLHKGLPPVHLEKMECTACHSGPVPEKEPLQVRTSRANRLGIHGRAQWFTNQPYILESVFVRGENKRVGPRRMMWPAFWARIEGEQVVPVLPEKIAVLGAGIIDGETSISQVLDALSNVEDTEGTSVLVLEKRLLQRDPMGGVKIGDYTGTQTVTTAMWGRMTTDTVATLLPIFDPKVETLPAEIDVLINKHIEALESMPSKPKIALLYGGRIFTRSFEGLLETTNTQIQAAEPRWVRLVDESIEPLVPDTAVKASFETIGTDRTITEEEVAALLRRLSAREPGARFGYVAMGKLFQIDGNDKLVSSDHKAAAPVSWAVAHDVRPAAQSLGVKGCTECHAKDASYLFSNVVPTGPLVTAAISGTPMHKFQDIDGDFQRLFGNSFEVRTLYKTLLFTAAGILGLLAILFAMLGLQRIIRAMAPAPKE